MEWGDMIQILQPPGWPRPKGYSNGISASGRMVVTAGVIGWDEREMLVSHRIDQQFAQALRNVVAILAEGGARPEHIVRLTIYVTSIQEYEVSRDELAPMWKEIIGDHYPAIALVEVARLVERSAKVEIEATAVVPE
jgi:enamine deaminase RidA (YjgF/YER057c/UK114 family)